MTLLQHAKTRLANAKTTLGTSRTQDAEDAVTGIERLIAVAQEQANRVDADQTLSATGKQQRKTEIATVMRQSVDEQLNRLERVIADQEKGYLERLQLPPLAGDDVQGRLANARADAVMVLDRAPDDRLAEAMETLARDPADVGHLMLTGFAERYLQARSSNVAAAAWGARKEELLVERLGDPARRAQAGLKALADVRAAHLMTKHEAHNVSEALGPIPQAPAS